MIWYIVHAWLMDPIRALMNVFIDSLSCTLATPSIIRFLLTLEPVGLDVGLVCMPLELQHSLDDVTCSDQVVLDKQQAHVVGLDGAVLFSRRYSLAKLASDQPN